MTSPKQDPSARKKALQWAGRIISVLVSGAIIYYCLRPVEWDRFKQALAAANLVPALAGMVVPLFLFWITDAAFTVKSFAWFDRPVRFRDYFIIKGAAYLLTLVNLTVSTGGIFIYFMRKTGISARKQAGLLLWRLWVAAMGAVIFLALLITGARLAAPGVGTEFGAQDWMPVLLLILAVVLESAAFWLKGEGVVFRHLKSLDPDSEFWTAFRLARLRHWLAGMAYTVPPLFVNFVGMFLVARAFNIQVPFITFMFYIPLALVFAALPIAFAQLGTTTLAWQFFFAAHGSNENIIAATIFIPTVRLLWRAAIGFIFMPAAVRELESGAKPEPKADTDHPQSPSGA